MHAPSKTKMASSTGLGGREKEKTGRKRKRANIPGFTSSAASTPEVTSQAPRGINAAEFAEARALEINNMVEAIKEADNLSGKRLFQTLPRHMRRRAMSHNVKRMPARLRQRASFEMNKPANRPSDVPKKKSRHYRRKPKNLLEEYTRRQRKHVWLETHIWHAKRMKMIDTWGYRLADHPNDKGFRAAYRAVKNNCMLQDISYYGCIEVSGVQSRIVQAMSHLTSQEAGLTIAAKHYVNGIRQGHAMLYQFDQYPYGAISPVSFLWRQRAKPDIEAVTNKMPQSDWEEQDVQNSKLVDEHISDRSSDISEKDGNAQLWVWSHPASFNSVFESIAEACNSVGRTSVERDSSPFEAVGSDCVVKTEQPRDSSLSEAVGSDCVVKKEQPCSEKSQLINGNEHSELKVISRQFDLLRFRVTGPQSHALLASTLKLSSNSKQNDPLDKNVKTDSTFLCDDKRINISSKWWQSLQDSSNGSSPQNELWNRLKQASSPSVLPPGCVIALTVLDPRLDLPVKKMSIGSVTEGISAEDSDACDETIPVSSEAVSAVEVEKEKPSFVHIRTHWPSDVAGSHIWDTSVRREVKETKIPEQELNRKRSELLVPGSGLELGEDEISHIPLLLIQQPGCSDDSRATGVSIGYGSGWDIILPCGWAMAFWIALVYRGARTGGLQESQTLALEQGVPFFPNDFPDTQAGEAYNSKLKDDGEAQYKRYPPAKRPNYDRLGVKSPFSPPWIELVKNWSSCIDASTNTKSTLSNTMGDSTRTKDTVSDSAQMDVSADDEPTKITGDSTADTKANSIVNNSPQICVSVVQPSSESGIATDPLTTVTCNSTKANVVENESDQTVGSIVQPFYVLRSRSKLSALRSYAARYKQRQMGGLKHRKSISGKPVTSLDDFEFPSIAKSDQNSLVCVQLRMVNRSVPVPNSTVAIPSLEDNSRLGKCRDFAGPLEPLHKGPKAHLAEQSLKNCYTREIVGFVSSGHYSLSRGCGFGVAFCVLPGLVKLLSSSNAGEPVVLVRGPSTQQYRFAYLTIF